MPGLTANWAETGPHAPPMASGDGDAFPDYAEEMAAAVAAELAGLHPQTLRIYERKGFPPDLARQVTEVVMQDPDVALETHAREELGLDPERVTPITTEEFPLPAPRPREPAGAGQEVASLPEPTLKPAPGPRARPSPRRSTLIPSTSTSSPRSIRSGPTATPARR